MNSEQAAEMITRGIGRRRFVQAVAALGAGAGVVGTASCTSSTGDGSGAMASVAEILQPGGGPMPGDHYLSSHPDQVLWGYVPTVHAQSVLQMRSGQTVTIDTVSHEGILEDQGRNPIEYFGGHDVAEGDVLKDAVDIAAGYRRTPRDFDTDGPHVVTGPIFVEGAQPGDVLKVETLEATPRVPYGVVSSRHGKGALALSAKGEAPAGIGMDEVMPPVATDGRKSKDPTKYGNVSTFTVVEDGKGVMPFGNAAVRFPLRPFMGMMGVAYVDAPGLTSPNANSVPPTLGGGNIDISLLAPGSTFYLPVFADGALFYVGDPHMAMGDG